MTSPGSLEDGAKESQYCHYMSKSQSEWDSNSDGRVRYWSVNHTSTKAFVHSVLDNNDVVERERVCCVA